MNSFGNKSTISLLQEYLQCVAGPLSFTFKVALKVAAFASIYGAYKYLCYIIPGAHRLPNLDLKDKTVLITGASSGLGRSLAFEFYKKGAKLLLAARSLDKLEELCKELETTTTERGWNNPNRPDFGYLDLNNGTKTSIEKQIENLIGDKNARIDVLVNNAGVSNRGSCCETSIAVQQKVFEVNFFGHIAVTKALLNNIPDGGAIIVTSSVQGRFALPYRSAYSASKHALDAFFNSLRAEERFGQMQVLIVSAGYLNTNFGMRALDPEGRPVGFEDENQKRGMCPELAASKIIHALINRESELILAPCNVKLALWARLLTPNLISWLLHRRAIKEIEANAKKSL